MRGTPVLQFQFWSDSMTLSEREIFLEAIEMDSEDEIRAWLDQACGSNTALRSAVEALLAAHRRSDNPLDQPRVASGAAPEEGLDLQTMAATRTASVPVASDVGKRIGPYRIMELIGEGGFGLVYVATQETPVRRRVALKILKPGMGSREVLARFEAERQAVAMMSHPNIAQIFDAGVTDDGRPYFVMELVKGLPITQFVRRNPMTLRQRVELFVDVCSAVHHAHQKGIIHRDLKPSNVLVSLHDGRPVVKVIDFGVAKAMKGPLTDKTIYTRFFSMIGTPSYMSPEQAAMSGLDVDTRSDIYSLGVLLYELVTGVKPFDRHRLNTANLDEMRRIICEEEPPRPSQRLTTLGVTDGETRIDDRAEAHGQVPIATAQTVPADLDWIIMRSLEKDRARRYESAAALAADLNRWLADEPVEARPPSRWYRLQKFARRNRVPLLAGGAIVLALLIGTVISVDQALRAIDQRNQKEAALQKALEAKLYVENFAERLKTANLLISEATKHDQARRWDDADRVISEAIELVPNYYLVWVHRGRLRAQQYRWPQAAADYAEALKLEAPVDQTDWEGVGALFQVMNRQADYELLYERAFSILSDRDSESSPDWQSLRACVLRPVSDDDARRLAELADEFLQQDFVRPRGPGQPRRPPDMAAENGPARERRGPRGQAGGPPGFPPQGPGPRRGGRRPAWEDLRFRDPLPRGAQFALAAWAHLQAGDLQRAEELLGQAKSDRGWPGVGIVDSLQAHLAAIRGQRDVAERMLSRAKEGVDELLGQIATARDENQAGPPWFEVAETWLAYRQAYRLVRDAEPNLPDTLTNWFTD